MNPLPSHLKQPFVVFTAEIIRFTGLKASISQTKSMPLFYLHDMSYVRTSVHTYQSNCKNYELLMT